MKNNSTKGEVNYYITENITFGLEIVKKFDGEEKEIKAIDNITKSREEINKVLDIMSKEFIKPDMAEEILRDIKYK